MQCRCTPSTRFPARCRAPCRRRRLPGNHRPSRYPSGGSPRVSFGTASQRRRAMRARTGLSGSHSSSPSWTARSPLCPSPARIQPQQRKVQVAVAVAWFPRSLPCRIRRCDSGAGSVRSCRDEGGSPTRVTPLMTVERTPPAVRRRFGPCSFRKTNCSRTDPRRIARTLAITASGSASEVAPTGPMSGHRPKLAMRFNCDL